MSKYRNNENIDYINQEIIKMLSLDGRMAYSEKLRENIKLFSASTYKKITRYRDYKRIFNPAMPKKFTKRLLIME
jgi:Lrp/AsnC family transcriptional regulator for asnA, asnC and gidA